MPLVHNLQSAPGELQQLIASPTRLCGLSGPVAAIFSSDNSERPWTAPVDQGATPLAVCFSQCGNFLVMGDSLGLVSVVYLPFKRRVWSKPTSANTSLAQQKVLEIHVGENGDLFILFSGSIMLRFEQMMFAKLHELLSTVPSDSSECVKITDELKKIPSKI